MEADFSPESEIRQIEYSLWEEFVESGEVTAVVCKIKKGVCIHAL